MSACVYVVYHRKQGHEFNIDYYLKTHMTNVSEFWGPYGLRSWNVTRFQDDDPSGILIQTQLFWESFDDFEKAWDADIPELMKDLPNYTTIVPVRYYGKVLAHS